MLSVLVCTRYWRAVCLEWAVVHILDTAYNLDFIIPVSLDIINVHVINEISLDDMSYVNTALYSLL